MKVYRQENVLEAAQRRIGWLFDEFPNVVVSTSGGKDSTVVLELALQVARDKARLPLKVMFLDQEAELASTIDTVREVMYRPEVEPLWFQMPIRMSNATSSEEQWLDAWNPDKRALWMYEQDPIAITENRFGTDRFHPLFFNIPATLWPDTPTAVLTGMRAEESPGRKVGMTTYPTYKGETWGKIFSRARQHFNFFPIYDWSYTDVWKAIHDHGWPYNAVYDEQYRYGVPVQNMRVSNLHHETSMGNLFFLQEIEPETYERLTARLKGIDSAAKLGLENYVPREVPSMFSGWPEYRDFLLEKLITDPDWRKRMRERFARDERRYFYGLKGKLLRHVQRRVWKTQVASIVTNDWEFVKLENLKSTLPGRIGRSDQWKQAREAEGECWLDYNQIPAAMFK